MEDFRGPSFCLGFELDFDTKPQSLPIDLSSESAEEDEEELQLEKIHQHAQADDPVPPPLLKRLKRGSNKHLPGVGVGVGVGVEKKEAVLLSSNLDNDEIEDFSSPEDSSRGDHSSEPKRSVCSSSKFAFHGHKVLNTKIINKQKTFSDTPASKSSITTKLEASGNKLMFPKLTVSPLRRFQLLDSDSDDPSVAEDQHDKAGKVNASVKEGCKPTQSMTGNQEEKSKQLPKSLPAQDLWKDFSPVKNANTRTHAMNRFYKENVMPEKGKNVAQSNEGHIPFSFSKGNAQKNNFHVDLSSPIPPSYHYFYHGDLRIQSLVRERLLNFSPLSAVDSRGNIHPDAAVDYMNQFGFGHKKESSQLYGSGNGDFEGYSKRGKKNFRSSYAQGATVASGEWVNTQSQPSVPNDAGRRRVHADCQSVGQWYTGQDGTRVYVSKSGQPMTGQIAYRQYRKESGVGFKRSRKKTTSKKK